MTYFDSLNFVYQLVSARLDLVVVLWALIALVLSLVLLHWLWGLAWNTSWGLFTRPSLAAFGTVAALVIGSSALFWLGAERVGTWLQLQAATLPKQMASDPALRYDIFVTAQQQLALTSGAADNEMALRNRRDLETLAQTAASLVRCPLTRSGPLGPGAPCQMRNPDEVAQETLQEIPPKAFPLTVTDDNPWVAYAVTTQIQAALSDATPKLTAGAAELRIVLAALFWIFIGLQVLIVPIAAVSDIRVHPQV
ncbi:hypothetical protein [uncultured Thiodictyon sp.]|uniref:hypothetical protein n=1 Tax=uncultured Thiodictyon sp. TaxID=1846217 RepID=UPI0025DB6255|nr:hypothetical protein [uncultured Thiodictyon sp.]